LIPLGARLLWRRPRRLVPAIGGILVAVTIMFVEMGMLSGVLEAEARTASLVRADLIVMPTLGANLHSGSPLPLIRLEQVAGVSEVARVMPVYEQDVAMRSAAAPGQPRDGHERPFRRIVALSFSPNDDPLAIGKPDEIERRLKSPGSVLFDRDSRPIYGDIAVGSDVEIGSHHWQVDGLVDIGPDIINDGAVVMSSGNSGERDQPIFGAVRLKPGADLDLARSHIQALLPHDVSVLTPAELRLQVIDFTLRAAPIGILFGIGALAGLLIGATTCYQVLFNEVADHLKMYTTLKATGFSDNFLRRTIVEQAILSALLGFAAGVIVALGFCAYMSHASGFTVAISPLHGVMVLAVTVTACVGAGLLAVRQVIASDPAELF
jgi:putative ABC transport system permease protein